MQRIVQREQPVVRLEPVVDQLFDHGFRLAAGEILHGFFGGVYIARGREGVRTLQILDGVLKKSLLGAVVAEAINLAVLVRPGGGALGHHVLALGEPFRALSAELDLRRGCDAGCGCSRCGGR